MVKSKLYRRIGSTATRQLKTIHKKGPYSFLKVLLHHLIQQSELRFHAFLNFVRIKLVIGSDENLRQ